MKRSSPAKPGDEARRRRRVPASTVPRAATPRSNLRCALPTWRCRAAVRSRPIAPFRYSAASSAVNRRSAARISSSSPRARRRANGSGGSARLVTTSCTWSGRWSSKRDQPVVDVAAIDDVKVVEDQQDGAIDSRQLVDERREHDVHRELTRVEERAGAHRGARFRHLQGSDDIRPEHVRIVVAFVE